MDTPIKIIVALFVALVVGATVIGFSKQMISESKLKMHSIGKGGAENELGEYMDIGEFSVNNIVNLAELCYETYSGKVVGTTFCYVMRSEIVVGGGVKNDLDVLANPHFDTSNDISSAVNVFLYYEPHTDKVIITK